jgi:predicted SAM-dependent methyltransferase
MIFLKKILKLILPKKFVKYLRGRLNHDGYLLFLFPPLKFFFKFLSEKHLKKLFELRILSYDYVYNYAIHRKKRKKIMSSYDPDKFYLNIGGGLNENKKNWRILEYCGDPILRIGYRYHRELIDYNVDLMAKKKWAINDNSVDLIYTSHCLEHLTQDATNFVFAETRRVLKNNGIFRISVPDVDLAYKALTNNDSSFFNSFQSNEELLTKKFDDKILDSIEAKFLKFFCAFKPNPENFNTIKSDIKNLKKDDLLDKYRDNQTIQNNYHDHLNWFNYQKLKKLAVNHGFNSEKVILSKKNASISEEMRSPEFDKTAPNYSVFVDILKS